MKFLARLRCWFRGYHVGGGRIFRYDRPGLCDACGKVGDGVADPDGE